ncbi:hypothetical protein BGX24_005577, partial [Mortierella sp. AD032]
IEMAQFSMFYRIQVFVNEANVSRLKRLFLSVHSPGLSGITAEQMKLPGVHQNTVLDILRSRQGLQAFSNHERQLLYSQVGNMTNLKVLTVKSPGLLKSTKAGFLSLGDSTDLGQVRLVNLLRHPWSAVDLQNFMVVAPNLEVFDLRPLVEENDRQVYQWLTELNKTSLGSNCCRHAPPTRALICYAFN